MTAELAATESRNVIGEHDSEPGALADATPGTVYYDLWENRSGNLIAEFNSEDEALKFVRDTFTSGDLTAILSWSLHRSDTATAVAYGKTLSALIDKRMPV